MSHAFCTMTICPSYPKLASIYKELNDSGLFRIISKQVSYFNLHFNSVFSGWWDLTCLLLVVKWIKTPKNIWLRPDQGLKIFARQGVNIEQFSSKFLLLLLVYAVIPACCKCPHHWNTFADTSTLHCSLHCATQLAWRISVLSIFYKVVCKATVTSLIGYFVSSKFGWRN